MRPRPVGLMRGYQTDDGGRRRSRATITAPATSPTRDADGYITYVGRADDVFKSNDYRLSPFELESALIEHAAVAEAAVVPAPDPMRLTRGQGLCRACRGVRRRTRRRRRRFSPMSAERLAPYKRVRRIEFAELPKTISGKIRRVELRVRERDLAERGERAEREYRIEDFSEG